MAEIAHKPEKTRHGATTAEIGVPAQKSQKNRSRIVWSVAGFDPSSGAGVTADLATFAAHGVFGCSAITALTIQSTLGVFGSEPVSPENLRATLSTLQEDTPPAGIKVGMLGSGAAATVLAEYLAKWNINESSRPVVVLDPVLRSSSGRELYPDSDLPILLDLLLPKVQWITPNWAELAVLSGQPVQGQSEAERAARSLLERFPRLHIVVTGGDQERPLDLLIRAGHPTQAFVGEHVETTSTHGTGCAFSSSLLSHLVLGADPKEAVSQAKAYVTEALRQAPGIGMGRGPMELLWPLYAGGGEVARLGE